MWETEETGRRLKATTPAVTEEHLKCIGPEFVPIARPGRALPGQAYRREAEGAAVAANASHRAEHWVVVRGTALVTVGNIEDRAREPEHYIPMARPPAGKSWQDRLD
jgi:mannose-6-phosphate isomerase-like protein (cupin superfamily)